jgi:hypothetical protein
LIPVDTGLSVFNFYAALHNKIVIDVYNRIKFLRIFNFGGQMKKFTKLFNSISKSKHYLYWQRSPAHTWGVVGFLKYA